MKSPDSERAPVEMWFDPVCPWAWLTSRWLMEVEQVRDVTVIWSVMSLAVLNEKRDLPGNYNQHMDAAWGPVRVLVAAAQEHGPEVVKPLYDAMGVRIHRPRRGRALPTPSRRVPDYDAVAAQALEEVGLPLQLAKAAAVKKHDPAVRRSHKRAISLVGTDVGTPVIAVDGVGFFGPVVSPAPREEAAGRLWDGCLLVATTPGFFELKRTRTVGPILN